MSAELSHKNGQAELVLGYGIPAWHGDGTIFQESVPFDEAMNIAFSWQAEMEQLQYGDGRLSSVHGIYRSDTLAELGSASDGYGLVQPIHMFDFCKAFFGEYTDIPISSAGALRGGKVLFLQARLGEINILNSGDIHRSFLTFNTSFDGTIKATAYKTYVREVCINTVKMGLDSAEGRIGWKHTKNVHARLKEAASAAAKLMAAQAATDENVKNALEQLAQRKLKRETYETILDDLFPGDSTRAKNVKRDVTDIFARNDNNRFPEWKGTAYAVFNAVTNYVDHARTVRDTQGIGEDAQRWESATIGSGATLKQKALERILVLSNGEETVEKTTYIDYGVNQAHSEPRTPEIVVRPDVPEMSGNSSVASTEPESDIYLYTTAPRNLDGDYTIQEKPNCGTWNGSRIRYISVPVDYAAAQKIAYQDYYVSEVMPTERCSKETDVPDSTVALVTAHTDAPERLDPAFVTTLDNLVKSGNGKIWRKIQLPEKAMEYTRDIYSAEGYQIVFDV